MSAPQLTRWHNAITPHVYRYLPSQYVREFFSSGRIMLSSFARFAAHQDEEKGDTKEGVHTLEAEAHGMLWMANIGQGYEAFVMSSSTIFDMDLMAAFKCDAAIHIKDTRLFSMAIAESMSAAFGVTEGFCQYTDDTLKCEMPEGMRGDKGFYWFGGLTNGPIGGIEIFFQKRLQYAHQCEYRMIWHVNHCVRDACIVECPKATEFCEPKYLT